VSEPDEPAGLYLHIPFCSAICPYCDFAVRRDREAVRAAFVDTLIAEVELCADWPTPIDSIYLGGGTPSILTPDQLARILDAVRRRLPVSADARLHLEANPEDVTPERVRAWRALGVATVSLGVQSFLAAELRALGRRHDPDQARQAARLCLESGFPTVSVDLIFGLPGQTTAAWRESLEAVVALGPGHVSCYQLTVHEKTTFGKQRARGRFQELPESEQACLFELTHAVLAGADYPAYEVSNFAASPAHRSRHNLKYWHHAPYLGLGPSAHSFDGARRWWNLRQLPRYERSVGAGRRPVEAYEDLTAADLALETVMLGLRTTDGIALGRYRARFDTDLVACNRSLIEDLAARGFLRLEDDRLAPTVRGLAVADGLAARFELGLGDSLPISRIRIE
jgi:oxygen-independent coproporphyrinogen-3 oxidase